MEQKSLSCLLQNIETYLAQSEMKGEPAQLYAPISYSMEEGGKRLRPMLTLLACGIFADEVEKAMPCAAAVEFFHNFTLLHDDIMDNAPIRRGKPSVFRKWNQNVAILSGDAMIVYAYQLLEKAPTELLPQLFKVFNATAMQVFEGQQYDMDFESRSEVSIEEYVQMINLKTAVLLSGAARMGAIVGGASGEDLELVTRFADELGLAFQLQDDLLDSYGTEAQLGKAIGGDILEGKKTFLMISALNRLGEEERCELLSLHQRESLLPEQKVARARELFDKADVRTLTEERIKLHFDRALEALDALSVPAERTAQIREFAQSLMGRSK
ncbi:MAG: polyprenyl synthetase family protein [Rikenellaceae bacterium]|nr:polyprenyl synthetase family protein [Rikenellaceae bacterium]